MIRVILPVNLQRLADAARVVSLEVEAPVTLAAVLDALEARYPMLRGTMRDHGTQKRRDFIRFFACGEDWTHQPADLPLPDYIAAGLEPLRIVGALAGG